MASSKVLSLVHYFSAVSDSAFLSADGVKMVFLRSHSSRLFSSLSSAWSWARERDLPINPNKCSCLTVRNLRPLSTSFSAADTDHRIPQVIGARDLGVPLDTTFTTSVHCREAEYSKAIAFHGPKILLRTIQNHPAVL